MDRQISARLKDMLTKDKMQVQEGFYTAFCGDAKRVLDDYFELLDKPNVKIELQDDGNYKLSIDATAIKIKSFQTTRNFV